MGYVILSKKIRAVKAVAKSMVFEDATYVYSDTVLISLGKKEPNAHKKHSKLIILYRTFCSAKRLFSISV